MIIDRCCSTFKSTSKMTRTKKAVGAIPTSDRKTLDKHLLHFSEDCFADNCLLFKIFSKIRWRYIREYLVIQRQPMTQI